MKKTGQFGFIVVVVALGFAAWQFRADLPFIGEEKPTAAPKSRERPPQGVIVSEVFTMELPHIITAVGTAKANESVDITSKVSAIITSLNFSEGQEIGRGTTLVQMDDAEIRANLTESEAERDNRQKLYDRALRLYETKNVPKAQVDLLLSELLASEAKIAANKARLSDYTLKAPFPGILGFREVSVGSLVKPGDVITTLDDTDLIKIDFDLPERILAEVKPDQEFEALSVAYPDKVFKGRVGLIASRVDEVTRAVRVRGFVPNEEGLLKPGMFLSIHLQISIDTDALMVSEEAVVTTINGHHVFVIIDDKAVRTSIEVGRRTRGFVEILDGLSEDDRVIVEGLQKVKDGAPVAATLEISKTEPAVTQ
jgi:membrane fusion protein, multidrug efflux system